MNKEKNEKSDKKKNYLYYEIYINSENIDDTNIFIENLYKQCEIINKKKKIYFIKNINGNKYAINVSQFNFEELIDKKENISNYFIWILLNRNNYENFNYLINKIIYLNQNYENKPLLLVLGYYKGINDFEVEDNDLDLLIERLNENYPYFSYTKIFNFDNSDYLTVISEQLEKIKYSSNKKSHCIVF